MKLCTYVIKNDTGLAPNPFWGYCTLAVCTPNHMGIMLKAGDWIMGNSPKSDGQCLVYAMKLSEVLYMDDYFRDSRFEPKKPKAGPTWKHLVGDNMYFKGDSGDWEKLPSPFHEDAKSQKQDLKHHLVYIAKEFYYFGGNRIQIPQRFGPLIKQNQGCKCSHDESLVREFICWLRQEYSPGILGDPIGMTAVTYESTSAAKTC